ncbi:hypothetical protein SAMN05660653_00971 [Desulfonatronum thiosulfatophilum]|uniref:Uncharacterized protein n=1 Tax=Desulfonatronum thiosulfatophilum TaxID=617002 RepID=A0A1G6BIK8_9BACT|nr:hypothetical protein SAMN05660653_00971 [Desulfonatronum thiosulfatophilum]
MVVAQTDLWVVAESDLRREVLQAVNDCRGQLEAHIAVQPEFATSLEPVDVKSSVPAVIQAMAKAGRICNVGPMAAVAGSVAQWVAERCASRSPNLIVENGGDLYLQSTRERIVGLLAVPKSEMSMGLRLMPEDFPCSLCSSSATIGHSLSFGQADLVVTRSKNAALADAAATALGNMLQSPGEMSRVMDQAKRFARHGLDGVFAQCGDQVGVWGKMDLVCLEST